MIEEGALRDAMDGILEALSGVVVNIEDQNALENLLRVGRAQGIAIGVRTQCQHKETTLDITHEGVTFRTVETPVGPRRVFSDGTMECTAEGVAQ